MNGYMGKVLHVDLSSGRLWDEAVNEDDARAFVGGSGLAARIIYDMIHEDTDPLGPQNPLVFMTGHLWAPQCLQQVATASALFLHLLESGARPTAEVSSALNCASLVMMALLFTGCSSKPVWLSIVEGKPQLHDGSSLWGSDSYAAQQMVRQALATRKPV